MAILCLSYILIFSLIPHKEARFMLPIIPFSALMAGYALQSTVKNPLLNNPKLLKYLILLYLLVELTTGLFSFTFKFHGSEVPAYLAAKPTAPHSVYYMPHFDAPYSVWTHRHAQPPTIVYKSDKNPTYARRRRGVPL